MSATMMNAAGLLNIGPASRIPLGEGRTIRIGGLVVAVFRTREGTVHATSGICPHKGGPLADGIVASRSIACPLHGCTFDLRTGEAAGGNCEGLKILPASLSDTGDILIGMA